VHYALMIGFLFVKLSHFIFIISKYAGINQVLIRNNLIFASSAKMNDYYLSGNNKAQKQYTMCHEIGHGFGLPHTDENFYNSDLGECMDYTSNPENNQQPGRANFEFLKALYGVLPTSGNDQAGQAVEATSTVPAGKPGKRQLDSEDKPLPDWLISVLEEVVPIIVNRDDGDERDDEHDDGWSLLHRSRSAVAHEMDLGNGYSVQVHKLLVYDIDSD
jgi:hypothetical protein